MSPHMYPKFKHAARGRASRLVAALAAAVVALPLLAVPATADTPVEAAVAAPGAVTDLVVTSTANSVSVSWGAPTDGGAPDRYRVHLKPVDGGRGKTKTPDAPKTSVTFKQLAAGIEYRLWVRALNDAGKSGRFHARVTTLDAEPVYTGGQAETDPDPDPPTTTTTLPPPEFADDFDWRIHYYTIGEELSITLPEAAGGTGPLAYSVEGVTSCNRGDAVDGDGCGKAHRYNPDGSPLVNWQAAGFSFDANTRVLSSNTGAGAPTAAKVTGAVSRHTEDIYRLPEGATADADQMLGDRYIGGRYYLKAGVWGRTAQTEGWYAFVSKDGRKGLHRLVVVEARPVVTELPVTIPVWYTVTDADGRTDRLTISIRVQS